MPSAAMAIAAGFALQFFFVEPVLSFRVAQLHDLLSLAAFNLTAITVSLLSSQKNQARILADSQRQQMERLYLLAQRLLCEAPESLTRGRVVGLVLEVFQIESICIADGAELRHYPNTETAPEDLADATATAQATRQHIDRVEGSIAVRYFAGSRGWTGAIGFKGLLQAELMASPLAALATLMLERLMAIRSERRAAAAAETEVLRTAILDALAHEFKTPLATILTAIGGIQESGGLQPAQADLAQVVESEVVRLGSLTTRLLRMAHLDGDNVKPRTTEVDLEEITRTLLRRYSMLWPERRYTLQTSGEVNHVMADAEMIRLAISQLLDNASKYSGESSAVDVELELRQGQVSVCVWNQGPPIQDHEREQIFDRFYRGENARQTSGTGLGLHVVKKIAAAHGGSIQLTSGSRHAGNAFRLSLPLYPKEKV